VFLVKEEPIDMGRAGVPFLFCMSIELCIDLRGDTLGGRSSSSSSAFEREEQEDSLTGKLNLICRPAETAGVRRPVSADMAAGVPLGVARGVPGVPWIQNNHQYSNLNY